MTFSSLIDPFRPAEGAPPKTLWAFLRWALAGAWPILILAALFSAVAGTVEVTSAFLLGAIIDTALESGPATFVAENMWLLIGSLFFFLVFRPVLFGLNSVSNALIVTPNISMLVLSRLHRWTMGHSVSFFDDDFAGRIAQKQMQTSRAITDIVVEVNNTMAFALATLLGSAAMLVAIDVRIAASLFVWLIGYLWLIRWFMPRIRKRSGARAGARSDVSGQVVDTITNIKTVKLFAHDDHEDRVALTAMAKYRQKALEFGYVSVKFRFFLMATAGILPVMLIGGTLAIWSQGGASAGDIAAAGTISLRIAQMTGWVSFTLMAMYANIGEAENGIKTLTPDHALADAPDAGDLPPGKGAIDFHDVSFAYGRATGGIDGVTLHVEAGEKLGIVGASGAGKSTLVSLLLRLYDTEKGSVLIDGTDISTVTQTSVRRQIGMVTQETAMFNRSARDNIMYGRQDADMDDVIAAAEKAEAHEFIQNLRDHMDRAGYDAHLGERGVKLSGGQRQRIALARAFLKDAPILVLDEATSALDSEVEAEIQGALERVMEGKTVLAVAHRLSTLVQMDRIIVMDNGQIVEQGNHEDLLAQGGLYARYWARQSGGFIGVQDAAE